MTFLLVDREALCRVDFGKGSCPLWFFHILPSTRVVLLQLSIFCFHPLCLLNFLSDPQGYFPLVILEWPGRAMSASEDAGAFVNSELDTVCTFFCGFLISVSGCAMAMQVSSRLWHVPCSSLSPTWCRRWWFSGDQSIATWGLDIRNQRCCMFSQIHSSFLIDSFCEIYVKNPSKGRRASHCKF